MAELAKYPVEFANSQAQFIHETRAHLEIKSTQLKILEEQVGQMVKILSKEQQESLSTLEEPSRVEVYAKELVELVAKEEESTSLESNEIRKEVEILPEFIFGEKHMRS